MMHDRGIPPSGHTLQGVLLANFREEEKNRALKIIEEAIESKTPMDKSTFLLCVKYMVPSLYNNGDITSMRNVLRQLASDPSEDLSYTAMELNKRLRDCIMEDQRRPSKTKNSVIIQREREHQWRLAVGEVVGLSKLL